MLTKHLPGTEGIVGGYLSRKPDEIRYTTKGEAATRLSIAISGSAVKQNGEVIYEDGFPLKPVKWVSIPVYGEQAEICYESLEKGYYVSVPGYEVVRGWLNSAGLLVNGYDWHIRRNEAVRVAKGSELIPVTLI